MFRSSEVCECVLEKLPSKPTRTWSSLMISYVPSNLFSFRFHHTPSSSSRQLPVAIVSVRSVQERRTHDTTSVPTSTAAAVLRLRAVAIAGQLRPVSGRQQSGQRGTRQAGLIRSDCAQSVQGHCGAASAGILRVLRQNARHH